MRPNEPSSAHAAAHPAAKRAFLAVEHADEVDAHRRHLPRDGDTWHSRVGDAEQLLCSGVLKPMVKLLEGLGRVVRPVREHAEWLVGQGGPCREAERRPALLGGRGETQPGEETFGGCIEIGLVTDPSAGAAVAVCSGASVRSSAREKKVKLRK